MGGCVCVCMHAWCTIHFNIYRFSSAKEWLNHFGDEKQRTGKKYISRKHTYSRIVFSLFFIHSIDPVMLPVIILATCWKTEEEEKIYIYSHLRILYDYMCFFSSLFILSHRNDDISATNSSTYHPFPFSIADLFIFFPSLHSFTQFLSSLHFLFQFFLLSKVSVK